MYVTRNFQVTSSFLAGTVEIDKCTSIGFKKINKAKFGEKNKTIKPLKLRGKKRWAAILRGVRLDSKNNHHDTNNHLST